MYFYFNLFYNYIWFWIDFYVIIWYLFIGVSFNYNDSIPTAYVYDYCGKCYGIKYGASSISNVALPYANKYLHYIIFTAYNCVWFVYVLINIKANSNGILFVIFSSSLYTVNFNISLILNDYEFVFIKDVFDFWLKPTTEMTDFILTDNFKNDLNLRPDFMVIEILLCERLLTVVD